MKLILAFVLLLALTSCYKPKLVGDKWQSKSAKEKFDYINEKIEDDTTPGDWYTIKMAQLFIQNNELSFDKFEDDMPSQGFLDMQKRDKLIHTVGMTAQVVYEATENNKYTGLLKGSNHAIMRFSSATDPDKFVTPGFTFKMFRDGMYSGNLFTMYALTGQAPGDSNVFLNDMTSHVPYPNSDAPLNIKMIKNTFQKVSDWGNMLGLSDLCAFTESGEKEENLNFPYRLQLHPTKQAKQSMPNNLDIKKSYYVEAMEGILIDTVFDVYAQETPMSEKLELIGHIKMKTAFTASKFGDEDLFLQHQKFDDDLDLRPEWREPAQAIQDKQENTFPQYHYPNIQD